MNPTYRFTILTAGEGGVGKTTFLKRAQTDKFSSNTELTIGADFFQKTVIFSEGDVKLMILDFGGQQRFLELHEEHIEGASGAFLMFDLTRVFSLDNIEFWINICRKYNPNLPILLLGSKSDLTELICIDNDYLLDLKDKYNFLDYLDISSKTGQNVSKAFLLLAKKLLQNHQKDGGV